MVLVLATKGFAAMTLAPARSRGWLDYEERVATYWPEFAQQGKQKRTVRQLLAHQAGLFEAWLAIEEHISVYSYQLWLMVLAISLLRQHVATRVDAC